MDPFSGSQPDDELCCSVLQGDLASILSDILSLTAKSSTAGLGRAISLAINVKDVDALRLLLKYAVVDDTIAEEAAQTEDVHLIEVILDKDWPIDQSLRQGSIPSILRYVRRQLKRGANNHAAFDLRVSFAVRNIDFLDWLLQRGADPNATSLLNETALSFAIREGTLSAVKRLIAAGTDIFRGDLLHATARRGEDYSSDVTFIVDLLVQSGLPLDTYEFDNNVAKPLRYGYRTGTALHVACRERNHEAVKALLRHGADPFRLQMKGARLVEPTPIQLASQDPVLTQIFHNHLEAKQRASRVRNLPCVDVKGRT